MVDWVAAGADSPAAFAAANRRPIAATCHSSRSTAWVGVDMKIESVLLSRSPRLLRPKDLPSIRPCRTPSWPRFHWLLPLLLCCLEIPTTPSINQQTHESKQGTQVAKSGDRSTATAITVRSWLDQATTVCVVSLRALVEDVPCTSARPPSPFEIVLVPFLSHANVRAPARPLRGPIGHHIASDSPTEFP